MEHVFNVLAKNGLEVAESSNVDPIEYYRNLPLPTILEPFRHLLSPKYFEYRARLLFFHDRYIITASHKFEKWARVSFYIIFYIP